MCSRLCLLTGAALPAVAYAFCQVSKVSIVLTEVYRVQPQIRRMQACSISVVPTAAHYVWHVRLPSNTVLDYTLLCAGGGCCAHDTAASAVPERADSDVPAAAKFLWATLGILAPACSPPPLGFSRPEVRIVMLPVLIKFSIK